MEYTESTPTKLDTESSSAISPVMVHNTSASPVSVNATMQPFRNPVVLPVPTNDSLLCQSLNTSSLRVNVPLSPFRNQVNVPLSPFRNQEAHQFAVNINPAASPAPSGTQLSPLSILNQFSQLSLNAISPLADSVVMSPYRSPKASPVSLNESLSPFNHSPISPPLTLGNPLPTFSLTPPSNIYVEDPSPPRSLFATSSIPDCRLLSPPRHKAASSHSTYHSFTPTRFTASSPSRHKKNSELFKQNKDGIAINKVSKVEKARCNLASRAFSLVMNNNEAIRDSVTVNRSAEELDSFQKRRSHNASPKRSKNLFRKRSKSL